MSNEKASYNLNTLNDIVKRDNCALTQVYTKVISSTRISFICGVQECSNEYDKLMQCLLISGAFCKECTKKRRLEKTKATNIKKYGCENVFQNDKIKEKIVETNLEKYGVDNPSKNEEIKKKIEEVNMGRYGVKHSTQNEGVKAKYKKTMLDRHGVINYFQTEECKQKIKESLLERYGVENPQHNQEIKQKTMETVQERYGCSNPMKNTEVQNKGKATNVIKYGVENPFQADECKLTSKETCLEKYGCEFASQSTEVKEKIRTTTLERYGVPHVSQCPDISDKQFKNSCKLKDYIYPCGKVVQVQGYEPFALDDLIAEGFTSQEIITDKSDVPEIWYEKDGTKRRYFCDIYIPQENKIVEVKSNYTYQHSSGNVQDKAKATIANGFHYEIWVYDGKGKKEIINYNS
jgi:hypothetical protein